MMIWSTRSTVSAASTARRMADSFTYRESSTPFAATLEPCKQAAHDKQGSATGGGVASVEGEGRESARTSQGEEEEEEEWLLLPGCPMIDRPTSMSTPTAVLPFSCSA